MADKATLIPAATLRGATLALRTAMRSHPGRVRGDNQDTCAAALELGAFVVCDGMGGAAAGEIASQMAADAFLKALCSQSPSEAAKSRLAEAVAAANEVVYQRSQKHRALRGMGTTLVGVLVEIEEAGSTAYIANVGDSRCYLSRNHSLLQLTTDHSVVEEQILAGLVSREQAEFSPVRNIITRAVGTQSQVSADIFEQPLADGDILLLTSDGLTRELPDREIARVLGAYTDLEAACSALIHEANASGGRDNVTVLLISKDDPISYTDK